MPRLPASPTPIRRGASKPGSSPPPPRPTIEQVAERAGVSVATVSRALRGLPNVAPSTRERVAAIARDLGYRADPFATRLASGRSRTVGVVVPMINSWYFANVVAGAEAVCATEGYDLLVLCLPAARSRREAVTAAASLERRVDGLVFVEVPLRTEDVAALAASGLGVVTIGQRVGPFSSVVVDNAGIGAMAAEHLLDLGHRHIAVIGAQADDPASFDVPALRIDGIRRALANRRIGLHDAAVDFGEFTAEGGASAAHRLLAARPAPTAIIALSDEMAFGALATARELGICVPRDLSVIGIDDHDAAGAIGLTTVRQHVHDHGALAARALLDHFGDTTRPPDRLTDAYELVPRDTTGWAPSDR
jgi:LacI family transcriptional regulator, repressor for deo operon, udp, cdd, tsx, nupC, and nupG